MTSITAATAFAHLVGWEATESPVPDTSLFQTVFTRGGVTLSALHENVEILDVARVEGNSFILLGEGNADRLFRWLEEERRTPWDHLGVGSFATRF